MKWLLHILICLGSSAFATELGIERQGDLIRVFTINNTSRCFWFQWTGDLSKTNGWRDYHAYMCAPWEQPMPCVSMRIDPKANRAFWRAKDCNAP